MRCYIEEVIYAGGCFFPLFFSFQQLMILIWTRLPLYYLKQQRWGKKNQTLIVESKMWRWDEMKEFCVGEGCYFPLFSCGKQLLRKQQGHYPVMKRFLLCRRKIVWSINGMCIIFPLKLWTRTNEWLQKWSQSWSVVLTALVLLNQKKREASALSIHVSVIQARKTCIGINGIKGVKAAEILSCVPSAWIAFAMTWTVAIFALLLLL